MATLKTINSLRLDTERFVMAFLKMEIDFGPRPTNLPQAVKEAMAVLDCFRPQAYFKVKIEPKTRIEEFTDDELRQIAEFIVRDDYFQPFNKFFYHVISGRDDDEGHDYCTVLDYIHQDGLEVVVTDPDRVGEKVVSVNPIRQAMNFYLTTGP